MNNRILSRLWAVIQPGPAWVTGGYVRDQLLHRPSHDIDLIVPGTLTGTQPIARRIARSLGVRPHRLGRPPKVVWHITSPEIDVDLWPLGNGSLTDDALRRDLTINALIMRLPDGEIFDPSGGIRDLESKRLRAISRENLIADPVRLVRIARFAAQFPAFSVESATAAWVAELATHLDASPRERIGAELLLLLRSPAPHRGLALLNSAGLAPHLFPDHHGAPYDPAAVHLLAAAHLTGEPTCHPIPGALREAGDAGRLGLFFYLFGIQQPSDCRSYGWPRAVRRHALQAASMLPQAIRISTASAGTRRVFISRCGVTFPAVFAAASAVAITCGLPRGSWQRWWRQWRRNATVLLHPRLPIQADEVATILGVPPGPRLGDALRALKDAFILGRIRSPRAARAFVTSLATRSGTVPEACLGNPSQPIHGRTHEDG